MSHKYEPVERLYLIVMSIVCTVMILGLITYAYADAPLIRVGIVDTGIDLDDTRFAPLFCKDALPRDFTGSGMRDDMGHGTHVAGLIKHYAGQTGYCLIIAKFYDKRNNEGASTSASYMAALLWTIDQRADIINLSLDGSQPMAGERFAMGAHPEIQFIVAAGNSSASLDDPTQPSYPACYDTSNMIVVGSTLADGKTRAYSSNYGRRVTHHEIGDDVLSTWPKWKCAPRVKNCRGRYSGTSQATAIATGKTIAARLKTSRRQSCRPNQCLIDAAPPQAPH